MTNQDPAVRTALLRFESAAPPVRKVPNALARRFLQICTTATAEAVADDDLTPLEFAVLSYITARGGEPDIDQRGLAERLGIDRNSTTRLLDALETKGLLQRRVNVDDRRARLVRLTAAGEGVCGRLYPKAYAGQMRLLDVLAPEERDLLLDLLTRVIEGNRDMARPGTGRRKPSGRPRTKETS